MQYILRYIVCVGFSCATHVMHSTCPQLYIMSFSTSDTLTWRPSAINSGLRRIGLPISRAEPGDPRTAAPSTASWRIATNGRNADIGIASGSLLCILSIALRCQDIFLHSCCRLASSRIALEFILILLTISAGILFCIIAQLPPTHHANTHHMAITRDPKTTPIMINTIRTCEP